MNQFQIVGHKLYAPDGQEFIVKGTNMFAWEQTERVDSIVHDWGFNAIRVPNFLLGRYEQPHPAADGYQTNQRIVRAFTRPDIPRNTRSNVGDKTVVIFDAHDCIGRYYEGDEFEQLKIYWREMAQQFRDNPYVWFNLHNEPGKKDANPDQWVTYHRELIDIIRGEGANNIIVVDGEAWGQDFHSKTILNHGHEVMAGNHNILFSLHVYDQWNHRDIGEYFDQLHHQSIPIMVGEYGSRNGDRSTLVASQQMMSAVQEREIGRMVWVFSANDDNDLTIRRGGHGYHFNGENTEALTDLGHLVWRDLQRSEDLHSLHPTLLSTGSITFGLGCFLLIGTVGYFLKQLSTQTRE